MIMPLGFSMASAPDLFGDNFGSPQLAGFTPLGAQSRRNDWSGFGNRGSGMNLLSTYNNGNFGVSAPIQSYAPAWQPMGFSSTSSVRSLPSSPSFGGYTGSYTPMSFGY